MDLEIKEELYKVKVGSEVYSIEYPSFAEAQQIAEEFKALKGDGEKSLDLMKYAIVAFVTFRICSRNITVFFFKFCCTCYVLCMLKKDC